MADYAAMSGWLTDSRVLEFYDGRDCALPLKRVPEKYSPRVLAEEGVTACLLVLEDRPIGYLQFYAIPEESGAGGVFGMDQFVGEVELWNRGLGIRVVRLMLEYLFEVEGASRVVLDPHADNLRAIRCYEKCGFRKVKLLPAHELHEGEYRDCWRMEATPELNEGSGHQPAPQHKQESQSE